MNILAIETSCDETAVSLLYIENPGTEQESFAVLGNKILSQADQHAAYGGVYPSLAKREHARNLVPIVGQVIEGHFATSDTALQLPQEKKEQISELLHREPELLASLLAYLESTSRPNLDYICVTQGPGLEPALWIGINVAQALSMAWDIPVIPVNHMEGHIVSTLIPKNIQGESFQVEQVAMPLLALLISGGHTQLVLAKQIGQYEILG